MKSRSTLLPWFGAIISEFVSGVFHGGFIGGAGGAIAADQIPALVHAAIVGAVIGGVKDVALFINANPMPNVFAQPTVAPVAGPVAPPTLGDQPKTLVSNS